MPVVHQDHPCHPDRHQVVHPQVLLVHKVLQVLLVHLLLRRLLVVHQVPLVHLDLKDLLHRVPQHLLKVRLDLQVHQDHQVIQDRQVRQARLWE